MIPASEIADFVTFLFSQSYETGQPLKDWRNTHSCESQFILTVEDLAQNLDHGDQMDMIILDFRKAFHK